MIFYILLLTVSDWELVFKALSGDYLPNSSDSSSIEILDPYEVWIMNRSYNENNPGAEKLDASYSGHYKSSLSQNWGCRNITKVRSMSQGDKT